MNTEVLKEIFDTFPTVNKIEFSSVKETRREHPHFGSTTTYWEINGVKVPAACILFIIKQMEVDDDSYKSWCVEMDLTITQARNLMKLLKKTKLLYSFIALREDFNDPVTELGLK